MADYIPGNSTKISKDVTGLQMGGFYVKYADKTILAAVGAVVVAGTVLGEVTATGALIPCVDTATDGSQIPYCVTTATVDATTADASAPVALTGEFRKEDLKWGGTTIITDALIRLMENRNLYANEILQR